MHYVTKQGDLPIDVATLLYGSSSYLIKLANDNNIDSLTDEFTPNTVLYYDEKVKISIDATLNRLNQISKPLNNEYNVVSGQSIFDVSTMLGYGIEDIIAFIKLTPFENLDQNNIDNNKLFVTKKTNEVSKILLLKNKILCTSFEVVAPSDVPANVRITEDSVYRITEDGVYRIIE